MESVRWALEALGIVLLLATLPGTLELLLLTTGGFRRSRRLPPESGKTLRLAVVIPAHDEALSIRACVASVAKSAVLAGDFEIVVVADNCIDETASIADAAGARVFIREDAVQRGKGYALRMAFDRLTAEGFEAFLIIDADSTVTLNLVTEVKRYLNTGCAAVQCRYQVANHTLSIRTRLMDIAFLAFNVARPRGRSGWGLSTGILGNGFALRAETLSKVPWDAASIVEDLEYHLRLVRAGGRVDFIDGATVYGEIPTQNAAANVQRSRWEGGRLRMAREWAPVLAAEAIRGKAGVMEPLLDLLTLPLAYHVLLLGLAILVLPHVSGAIAAAALGLVVVHVFSACAMGAQPVKAILVLVVVPFYILWKLTTLAAVAGASRKGASWLRTGRDIPVQPGPTK